MLSHLAMPDGLDEVGRRAHAAVVAFLERKNLTWADGGRRFYSPREWVRRGELAAPESENLKLVLAHDGAQFSVVFNPPPHREAEELLDEVTAQLEAAGTYPELCYEWYTLFWALPEPQSGRRRRSSRGNHRRLRPGALAHASHGPRG